MDGIAGRTDYAIFLAVVYFAPLFGGMIADKIGYGKCVTIGLATMFLGYLGLAIPTGADAVGKASMFAGLACVSLGTGLFKGNLQVLVGNLYDDPKYSSRRDSAFSLFYMAINIGAMFAPSMAKWITNTYLAQYGFVYDAANTDPRYLEALYGAYGLSFGVACVSLILSALIYFACRGWFKHADVTAKQAAKENDNNVEVLTPKQEKDRIVALLLYMAINIGAMFAPSMAKWITNTYLAQYGFVYDAANTDPRYLEALYGAYGLSFGVACVSLILSALIYFACRGWFKHADVTAKQAAKENDNNVEVLTPKQEKDRIVALLLVFAVVIFFWMAFHQNGSALTFFAKKYTDLSVGGGMRIWFNIFSLALIALSVYTGFGAFQAKTSKNRVICGVVTLALWGVAIALFLGMSNPTLAQPSDFQQFNPFFVVALTPFSMAFFGTLANRGKEVSAPTRIAWGMFVAALGFGVITLASTDLISPMNLGDKTQSVLSPSWLISTYFTLTLAELLLSPMGISFVSKVAPPKYKGLMMGGWFVATAIGNYLSSIPSMLWNKIPLMYNWGILIALCLVSALVMFALLKKLKQMTA